MAGLYLPANRKKMNAPIAGFCRPSGLGTRRFNPALKRRAIVGGPSGHGSADFSPLQRATSRAKTDSDARLIFNVEAGMNSVLHIAQFHIFPRFTIRISRRKKMRFSALFAFFSIGFV